MDEKEIVETEPAKTELIVEQSDLDMLFGFPVFGQIENIDKSTSEMLLELQKLNEYLILLEEEKELMLLEVEEPEIEVMQEVTEEEPEEEIVVDYDPLIMEQLEILNAHMEVSQEYQQKQLEFSSESTLMLVVVIVSVVALKAFVGQITKW